jgi:hypothetical protein
LTKAAQVELDELVMNTEVSKVAETDININQFNRRYNWHFYIEVSVAVFAFIAVMIGMFSGHVWYPLVIEQLLPEFASQQLSMHFLMYFSMACCAIYCLFVPIKLAKARAVPNVKLACSLKERVESEIQHFEKQKTLWTAAHIWSFLPANVIGLSFFWGLQVSLLDQWFPSLYLMAYIGFLVFSNWGGLKLQKKMLEKEVAPILQELYQYRQELSE